ncbi:hypothetical protein TNIN_388011 [Trichonephila inaurata madagascariensis]|uniref:Uncharacterized protein n=1 Tax=Trichonephila inaurata madagascariensis TaxID=2747483 RepID=A0A8X7CBP1_9ARAC|nr:hypothetical protein TNIN_285951 [Trichonephila inaurata madagascariensis]GFY63453.1 hypothetical protein TNIN_388011 [Trichonephila inaurata madagascariensis]
MHTNSNANHPSMDLRRLRVLRWNAGVHPVTPNLTLASLLSAVKLLFAATSMTIANSGTIKTNYSELVMEDLLNSVLPLSVTRVEIKLIHGKEGRGRRGPGRGDLLNLKKRASACSLQSGRIIKTRPRGRGSKEGASSRRKKAVPHQE